MYPSFSDGSQKMQYEEHRSGYRRGLDCVDIVGGKSTHLPRGNIKAIIYRGCV